MKTTILEISEPAMLAALEELKQAVPDAKLWDITLILSQRNPKYSESNETVPVPNFKVTAYINPPGDDYQYVGGHAHDGLDFGASLVGLLKKYTPDTPEVAAKKAEIKRLEDEVEILKSAVRS